MKIDNRIFLPFVGPFVALPMVALLCLLSGADWDSNAAFGLSLSIGVFVGCAVAIIMAVGEDKSLGYTYIGKRKND